MKALLVIDSQKGFLQMGDFSQERQRVKHLIEDFKRNGEPVIFMCHIDTNKDSPICDGTEGSELDSEFKGYADHVIEKDSPSSFYKTNLEEQLQSLGVDHVFITGFNTEYCPQFTAIAAYDRGYHVTFIENATATANDDHTYEFPGRYSRFCCNGSGLAQRH